MRHLGNDTSLRLSQTVAINTLTKRAVYVADVDNFSLRVWVQSGSDVRNTTSLDNLDFDIPLGYLQVGPVAMYFARSTSRYYKVGVGVRNLTLIDSFGGTLSCNPRWLRSSAFLRGVGGAYRGLYPKPSIPTSNIYKRLAIAPEWAVDTTGLLWHQGLPVGVLNEQNEPQFSSQSAYLKELYHEDISKVASR